MFFSRCHSSRSSVSRELIGANIFNRLSYAGLNGIIRGINGLPHFH
jgi:hypothetical protein